MPDCLVGTMVSILSHSVRTLESGVICEGTVVPRPTQGSEQVPTVCGAEPLVVTHFRGVHVTHPYESASTTPDVTIRAFTSSDVAGR